MAYYLRSSGLSIIIIGSLKIHVCKARRMLCPRGIKSFFVRKRLIGESFSSFCASSLQDLSSVSSLHALAEAVLLLSLTLFGLVCSKHIHFPPFLRFRHVPTAINHRQARISSHRNQHYILFNTALSRDFSFFTFS